MKKIGLRLVLPVTLVMLWWVTSAGSASPFYPPLREVLESFRDTWMFAQVRADVIPSLKRLLVALVTRCGWPVCAVNVSGRFRWPTVVRPGIPSPTSRVSGDAFALLKWHRMARCGC